MSKRKVLEGRLFTEQATGVDRKGLPIPITKLFLFSREGTVEGNELVGGSEGTGTLACIGCARFSRVNLGITDIGKNYVDKYVAGRYAVGSTWACGFLCEGEETQKVTAGCSYINYPRDLLSEVRSAMEEHGLKKTKNFRLLDVNKFGVFAPVVDKIQPVLSNLNKAVKKTVSFIIDACLPK